MHLAEGLEAHNLLVFWGHNTIKDRKGWYSWPVGRDAFWKTWGRWVPASRDGSSLMTRLDGWILGVITRNDKEHVSPWLPLQSWVDDLLLSCVSTWIDFQYGFGRNPKLHQNLSMAHLYNYIGPCPVALIDALFECKMSSCVSWSYPEGSHQKPCCSPQPATSEDCLHLCWGGSWSVVEWSVLFNATGCFFARSLGDGISIPTDLGDLRISAS